MKVLLCAINAKYIHSNLAVYSLKAYAEPYREQIEIAEFTINHCADDILEEIYKKKAGLSRIFVLCMEYRICKDTGPRDQKASAGHGYLDRRSGGLLRRGALSGGDKGGRGSDDGRRGAQLSGAA